MRENLKQLFPKAILTLDVCHVVERLWSLGHHLHAEGSEALSAWVEELKTLVYEGKAAVLVKRLKRLRDEVSAHGPGTKGGVRR